MKKPPHIFVKTHNTISVALTNMWWYLICDKNWIKYRRRVLFAQAGKRPHALKIGDF